MKHPQLPNRTECIWAIITMILYLAATGVFVGLRSDHFLIAGLFLCLFFWSRESKKLAVALLPFIIFAISYDWMRICPNYEVNPIDIRGLYETEKECFGICTEGTRITLCEYFSTHHHVIADLLAGFFYLCWVPVPIAFGIGLYFKKHRKLYLHFSLVFLLVNLLGFAGYYIHPAAPPWYVMEYGFEPIMNTPGHVGGLGRFDQLVGLLIFESIYGRNSNVFAALPSLHSAYMVVTLYYAIKGHCPVWLCSSFAVIMAGIWCTAVYSGHHYVIDVLLGISCALLSILLFEEMFLHIKSFRNFLQHYYSYIK